MLQSTRLRNLSPRVRLSTATMSVSPRAFSALTRLEPIKPAAPVTMIMRMSIHEQLVGLHHGGAEPADDDPGRTIRPAHRIGQGHPRRQHRTERCDHGIARTG